jgi:hypothetical protein
VFGKFGKNGEEQSGISMEKRPPVMPGGQDAA